MEKTGRIVIVTAEVGEGHAAAARALAAELAAELPEAEVVVCDALEGLGRFLRIVLLDAYRWQLRFAPWVFGILYGLFARVGPFRWLGRIGLAALGGRSLLRLVARHRPTMIVSTYPAATNVLGHLRRRGRLNVPVYATITDLAGVAFWAHPGIDLHLVMHDACIGDVERVAGRGSARRVRPLVAPHFFTPQSQAVARRELGLPHSGRMIIVSGGGWAAGDLTGAARSALAVSGATVVVLAGRDERVLRQLEREFFGERRVRVLAFSDRMSDLLAAADAIVHSTGGVTCLEALVRGCPIVAYGAPPGHAPLNARVMASLGLGEAARSRDELRRTLERVLARPRPSTDLVSASSAASVIATATPRQPAAPARPRRRARVAVAAAVAASFAGIAFSTDIAYALAARLFELEPITKVGGFQHQIALVVRAPAPTIPQVVETLSRTNAHASFAISGRVGARSLVRLALAGDRPLPEVSGGEFADWFETKKHLREQARAYRLLGRYLYLAPADGFTIGEYLLARDLGARPVRGSVYLGSRNAADARSLHAGDIVVLTLPRQASAAANAVRDFLRSLARQHLAAAALPPNPKSTHH